MMISPEGYYEEHLKGKTKEQIMTNGFPDKARKAT